MKRFLMLVPLATAGLLTSGLAGAGSATAGTTLGAGSHRSAAHVINLHKAFEARLSRLRHTTQNPPPLGMTYPKGMEPSPGRGGNDCPEPYCPVSYEGGPVQLNPHVYLLLWGPSWSTDPNQAATASYLENFFKGLGGTGDNWSTITSQYGDSSGSPTFNGSVYMGASQDISVPPAGVGQAGIAAEADTFAASQGITDLADAQIVVATQSGTCPAGFYAPSVCGTNGGYYCAWHNYSNEAYINLPYLLDAGTACGQDAVNTDGTYDGFSMVGGHEYAETITDPQIGTGWLDPNDQSGGEIADKCAWSSQSSDISLSTGNFAMQPLWSNYADGCAMSQARSGDITIDSPGTQHNYQWTKQVSLQIIGTSSEGNHLAWSASGLPSGLTINTSSGLLSGQVKGTVGTYHVTVSASDSTVTSPLTVNFSWIVSTDVGSLVKDKGSGLCLNDSQWVITPGNEIFLWACASNGAEKFSHPTNRGELIVFGQCMTDAHAARGAGQLQQIFPCAGTTDQEWYHNSQGEYVLQANNLCLTDPADATQNGTPVVVEKCTGAKDQLWTGS